MRQCSAPTMRQIDAGRSSRPGGLRVNDAARAFWPIPAAWGTAGDIPVPGDYDGNGLQDIAVWRPSTGTWFLFLGQAIQHGTNGDIPLPLPAAIRQPFYP